MCFEKIKDFANSWANVITIGLTIIGIIIAIIGIYWAIMGVVTPIETLDKAENSPPYIIMKANDSHFDFDKTNDTIKGWISYDFMTITKPDRYRFISSIVQLQKDGKDLPPEGGGAPPVTNSFLMLSTGTSTGAEYIGPLEFHRGDNVVFSVNYNIEIYDVLLKKTYKGQLDTPLTFNLSRAPDQLKLSTIKW